MKSLIAAVASVALMAAAVIAFVLVHRAKGESNAGPDPYAGTYPLVSPAPTRAPAVTWRPTGVAAGPLPVFRGSGSRVIGRITDRVAGVSYAKFAPPWHRPKLLSGGKTGAEEIDSKNASGLKNFWYVAVYSGPLSAELAPGATGPDALRAAAELHGQDWVKQHFLDEGRRAELAGRALTIDGHRAWLTAFRMTHTDGTPRAMKSQTEVVVAIDTGRRAPAIVTVTVPDNKNLLLPDINTVVRSLHVVR